MNNDELRQIILKKIAEFIDIPDSAYETAEKRYVDLGDCLSDASRTESASYDPHIFPQGSFRLGLVFRVTNQRGKSVRFEAGTRGCFPGLGRGVFP